MKRHFLIMLAVVMCLPQTAYAEVSSSQLKYSFTGKEIEFARHTPTNTMGRYSLTENIRRDKDVQLMPPVYFYGDGVFATEASNPYVTVSAQNYYRVTTPTDNSTYYDTLGTGVNIGNGVYVDTSGSSYTTSKKTEPLEYSDDRIGTLKIKSIDLSAKVYEGDSLTNLAKGLGHFSHTSAWDGNVGIAGHNSGTGGYFEDLNEVEKGDKITYTTKYGTRTYEVTNIKKIDDDDFSELDNTRENRLTLITCVTNQASKRLCVIAEEI